MAGLEDVVVRGGVGVVVFPGEAVLEAEVGDAVVALVQAFAVGGGGGAGLLSPIDWRGGG